MTFVRRDGELCAEGVPLTEIARRFGTPCYVYSRAAIERGWNAWRDALQGRPHFLCYAVKANSNLAILDLLVALGAGFDIVSGGELQRVLRAGGEAGRVVFSGVGKSTAEIRAALAAGIRCFNVESAPELDRIAAIASAEGRRAPVALRVNPEVEPGTHPHVSTGVRGSKFGVTFDEALSLAGKAAANDALELLGLACHIGSQIVDLKPYLAALDRLLALVRTLGARGIGIRHLDLGGGLGIRYRDEAPPEPAALVEALYRHPGVAGLELHFEPGRSVVGEAGVLLTRVEYLKPAASGTFVVVDAAMNDLLRPALYGAWQDVVEVRAEAGVPSVDCDVVGPVCESADFLARGRRLAVREGDLLAVLGAGAYGAVMASNYNSRPRPAEVLVEGARLTEVRRRESFEDLIRGETGPTSL